jgi:hypothetical protein
MLHFIASVYGDANNFKLQSFWEVTACLKQAVFSRVEPAKHRRFIVWLMIAGTIVWALHFGVLPFFNITPALEYPNIPFPLQMTLAYPSNGFGIVRDNWLSFLYMGAILLLVSYNPGNGYGIFAFLPG